MGGGWAFIGKKRKVKIAPQFSQIIKSAYSHQQSQKKAPWGTYPQKTHPNPPNPQAHRSSVAEWRQTISSLPLAAGLPPL
jgi:hypothetical protein